MNEFLVFQVTIKDHRESLPRCSKGRDGNAKYENTEVRVPLKTKIGELKKMRIFQGGQESYDADKFTLEHEGVELRDECTLGSICSPGSKELRLEVHSICFTVKKANNEWNFPLNVKRRDLNASLDGVVKREVLAQKAIHPDRVRRVALGCECDRFPCSCYSTPDEYINVWLN